MDLGDEGLHLAPREALDRPHELVLELALGGDPHVAHLLLASHSDQRRLRLREDLVEPREHDVLGVDGARLRRALAPVLLVDPHHGVRDLSEERAAARTAVAGGPLRGGGGIDSGAIEFGHRRMPTLYALPADAPNPRGCDSTG